MSDVEQITPEGLAALRAEVEHLETKGRAEIAERIKAARELGDLKENAEYHIAKEEQAHLETKILRLIERLRNAQVVDGQRVEGQVSFGSTVKWLDETSGKEQEFTLVGPTEADAKGGKLSAESPVARALIGAKEGETVEVEAPGGTRALKVLSVS